MTKRPSPFEMDICRQSKIHINNYENDSNAQRNLQEETLKKLQEGSKKLYSNFLMNDDRHNEGCKKNHLHRSLTNYFIPKGRKMLENARKTTAPWEILNKCSFCDSRDLTYQCGYCLEFYCTTCSFANYESFEDGRTCLSCS